MPHSVSEKQKLLNRVRRLRGQVEALERALDAEVGCAQIMQQLTAARGAINGLMAEVVEDHIRMHMVDPDRKPTEREAEAAEELVSVMHSYINYFQYATRLLAEVGRCGHARLPGSDQAFAGSHADFSSPFTDQLQIAAGNLRNR